MSGGRQEAARSCRQQGAAPATKAARVKAGGWSAFTDGGAAPRWAIAARVVMVLALVATIPTILNLKSGNRLLWTVAIAGLPFFWMTFGYYLWRRICPLAVAGQLGRIFGKPGTRKMGDWMSKHYVLVQLGLMFVALTLRLVATNGSDVWLAGCLGVVVASAFVVSFVYAVKTWCNFRCPVGLVEKIHDEPAASAATGGGDLTSQCSPCVACKKHCPDIDLEQGYWKEVNDRPRRIAYFAWPGIVVAFYAYYYLVSGSWDYYFGGGWAYERELPSHMLDSGWFFLPEVSRIVAAPLTLLVFGAGELRRCSRASRRSCSAGSACKLACRRAPTAEAQTAMIARVRHGMLAFCGLVAFNAFYCFAGQPTLRNLPGWVVAGWGLVVVFASTAMFMRRISRREDQYVHEKFAQKILKKWEWGDAPPSDDLKDIYLLHTERTKQRESRLRAYKETVREMVADGVVTRGELVILDSLRAQLGVSDKDHGKIVGELSAEDRRLFDPAYQGSVETRIARQQYRKDLERLVVEAARMGIAPAASTMAQLRAEHNVHDDEEQAELTQILAPGGPIAALYDAELADIARLAAASEATNQGGANTNDSASLGLLRHLVRKRAHEHVVHALGILAVITKRPEVSQVRTAAETRGGLKPHVLEILGGVDARMRDPLLVQIERLGRAGHAELSAGPILGVSSDGSRYIRATCGVLLSRFEDDASRKRMTAMLDDPDVIVREAAVRAMGAKSRLTRDLLAKVLQDPEHAVRQAAVRAVSGTTSNELPAIDPAMLAQTTKGVGKQGVYATLDANAAMASLTLIEKMMLIRQVPILAELDAEDLEELAAIVEEHRIDANKDVFREGDAGDAVYLIVKGMVRVIVGGPGTGTDRPERTISELGPGQCIGEMAVLDSAPRSATVRAVERTRMLRVPGEGFKRVMSERPEMSAAIVAELVRRMRNMMTQQPGGPPGGSLVSIPVPRD